MSESHPPEVVGRGSKHETFVGWGLFGGGGGGVCDYNQVFFQIECIFLIQLNLKTYFIVR